MSAPVVEYPKPHMVDPGYRVFEDGTISVYGKNVTITSRVIPIGQDGLPPLMTAADKITDEV